MEITGHRMEPYVPADVVAGFLGMLAAEKFTGDTERIHSTLAHLQAHYPILRDFSFSKGDLYPFSRELEASLALLQRSRLIGMENPDYDAYVVRDSAKKYIKEKVLSRFTEEEILQLREIARKFEESCSQEMSESMLASSSDVTPDSNK